MKFKITRDTKGLCAWPDMELEFAEQGNECMFYDPKCEYRGAENLWDLCEDILGEQLTNGDLIEITVTRITKEKKNE